MTRTETVGFVSRAVRVRLLERKAKALRKTGWLILGAFIAEDLDALVAAEYSAGPASGNQRS